MPLVFLVGKMIDTIGRRAGAAIVFSIGAASTYCLYTVSGLSSLTVALAFGIFSASAYLPVLNAFTTELFPTERRGDGFAWANNLIGRSGYVLSPIVVGYLAGRSRLGPRDPRDGGLSARDHRTGVSILAGDARAAARGDRGTMIQSDARAPRRQRNAGDILWVWGPALAFTAAIFFGGSTRLSGGGPQISDKVLHAAGFAALCFLYARVAATLVGPGKRAATVAFAGSVLIGAALEVWQAFFRTDRRSSPIFSPTRPARPSRWPYWSPWGAFARGAGKPIRVAREASGPRPRLIVVTDASYGPRSAMVACIESAIERASPGSVMVQLRDREMPIRHRLELGRELSEKCRSTGQFFVVNDRCDLAVLLSADGVHLGEASIAPVDARSVLSPGAWVSCAAHALDTAVPRRWTRCCSRR